MKAKFDNPEINKLAMLYKKTRNEEIWGLLYEHIKHLITHYARKDEDLRQECLEWTLKSFVNYHSSKGNYTSYLPFFLKSARRDYYRKNSLIPITRDAFEAFEETAKIHSINRKIKDLKNEESQNSFENILEAVQNLEAIDEILDLEDRINKLKPKELDLVHLLFEGYTYKEMGIKYNCSREYIRQLFVAIFNKLNKNNSKLNQKKLISHNKPVSVKGLSQAKISIIKRDFSVTNGKAWLYWQKRYNVSKYSIEKALEQK